MSRFFNKLYSLSARGRGETTGRFEVCKIQVSHPPDLSGTGLDKRFDNLSPVASVGAQVEKRSPEIVLLVCLGPGSDHLEILSDFDGWAKAPAAKTRRRAGKKSRLPPSGHDTLEFITGEVGQVDLARGRGVEIRLSVFHS
jgi:hypothetical protein